jgi:transposase
MHDKDEKATWDIYNTLTEVEATFRILKTDLSLRPVFHQKDDSTEAHIHLGVLAYTIVKTIRYKLKKQNIHHGWKNIVRIMNTQKTVTTSMKNDKHQVIIIKKCSRPNSEASDLSSFAI